MTTSRAMTIPERFLERVARTPGNIGYLRRINDRWVPDTWAAISESVCNLSNHLVRLGLQPGDRAAIMMPTCAEWEICHLAILAAGGAVVGLDAHDTAENVGHIVRTTQPSVLITVTAGQAKMLADHMETPPRIAIVSEGDTPDAGIVLGSLIGDSSVVSAAWPVPGPDDLATVIFTSGSTGKPKGVPFTQAQLSLACDAILDRFPTIGDGTRLACWLPLSNLFQRIINLCGMIRGAQSYIVENPARIVDLLPEIRPTLFIGVPRFFEKLHAGILANLESQPYPKRIAVAIARKIALEYRRRERNGIAINAALRLAFRAVDNAVLRHIRATTGPNMQFMVSGSAPLPVWLMEDFHAMGWLVLEAYGTSENVVPIAINTLDAYKFGSVGRPLPQNEVRIADDGELLVRGKGLFSGYWGDVDREQVVDTDGYLHTGDFARLDKDGFLWLAGRKSDVFKTSTGRRIAPVPIENCLKQLPYVEHALVCGRDRPFPIALLSVNANRAAQHSDFDDVLQRISVDVSRATAHLAKRDQPAGVLVTQAQFTIADGHLTSNLKLKRRNIETSFQAQIDALYAEINASSDKAKLIVQEAS